MPSGSAHGPVRSRAGRPTAQARWAIALLSAIAIAACAPSPPPSPSTSTPAPPGPTPSAGAVAFASPPPSPPSATSEPSETAAHLRLTKSVTNLAIGVARTGVTALAMRPGNPPTYVAISADHRVWLSSDGTRWRRGGDMPAAEGGNVWWIRQLVVLGSTFVAFGTAATLEDPGLDGPYSGVRAGYVWTSADGESWARTRLDNFAVGNALVDDGRLVATGGLSGQFTPSFATSADGKTWSRPPIDGDPWPARPGRSDWYSVGPLAGNAKAGYLFLSNHQQESNSPDCQRPIGGASPSPTVPPVATFAWRSTDLRHWQPTASAALGCARPGEMITGPAGTLIMSAESRQTAEGVDIRAWVSADGLAWREIAQPPDPLKWLGSLAIAPDGTFLAIGDGIWESVDGEHWARSAPALGLSVEQFAGDLAIACDHDKCYALHLG